MILTRWLADFDGPALWLVDEGGKVPGYPRYCGGRFLRNHLRPGRRALMTWSLTLGPEPAVCCRQFYGLDEGEL